MNDHSEASKEFGLHLGAETIAEHKKLLAKINSESLINASAVKGSIYFYTNIRCKSGLNREELVDSSTALDAASKDLEIEIRYENKHHRWIAEISYTLRILEFATISLNQNINTSPEKAGINAELRWRDKEDFENIIHLAKYKGDIDWQFTRYA